MCVFLSIDFYILFLYFNNFINNIMQQFGAENYIRQLLLPKMTCPAANIYHRHFMCMYICVSVCLCRMCFSCASIAVNVFHYYYFISFKHSEVHVVRGPIRPSRQKIGSFPQGSHCVTCKKVVSTLHCSI